MGNIDVLDEGRGSEESTIVNGRDANQATFIIGKMETGRSFMKDGWYYDVWDGQVYCHKVEEVLFRKTTKYQEVLIFKSKNSGKLLVLDGDVQCAEKDEFGYQEMIAHVPMACHPNPKKVLIVGGGDGGVIRELSKHPEVEQITLCEIDEEVIRACKEFMPSMAKGFSSSKLTVHIGDGFQFVKQHQQAFDLIINDIPDRTGANDLTSQIYSREYFGLLKAALKPNGMFISQEPSVWNDLKCVHTVMEMCSEFFSVVDYNMCMIPSFPDMQGFVMCSLDRNTNFREPLRKLDASDLKYYNSGIHRASFAVPEFARKELQGVYKL
ncbi:spermidine synthase-like isoform X2 [Acanthaster planci]|uniref:Spermidine synthase-like isoform X2 n=1 Tax=Acanthaster planci TaxID=133434 RepID=A0A8B7YUK7_ACAPL|nr:spermidine synthase-like isoform X2 [Acanthaster planci]